MSQLAAAGAETARIGPNAITRTIEALRERVGAPATSELLRAAGLARYGTELPTAMVSEDDVTALYGTLRTRLSERESDASMRLAGSKTAAYLLAHRIPRFAQVILRLLPARFAAGALLRSITKHTWTFAGSGIVSIAAGHPARIAIAGCPLCRGSRAQQPLCSYYAESFAVLFRELVSERASVTETACQALGAPNCVFEIRWAMPHVRRVPSKAVR